MRTTAPHVLPYTALDTRPSPAHRCEGLLAGGDHTGLDLRESLRGASPEGGQDLGFVPKGQGPALPSPCPLPMTLPSIQ